MIIFFGPAGSGKSVQGHILAARQGWRWLSAGQLLRETGDPTVFASMAKGDLVDNDTVNKVMDKALANAAQVDQVIFDGWPRALEQAHWLVERAAELGATIDLIVVLEVPTNELIKRLHIRGRADDTVDAIDERLSIYHHEVYPILAFFTEEDAPIVHIDGTGTVGEVHDRIVEELTSRQLV